MRLFSQWIIFSLSLLVVSGVVGLDLYRTHEGIRIESRDRLLRQADAVNKNLSLRLQTTSNALDGIRSDLPPMLRNKSDLTLFNRRLQVVADVMTGVHSIVVMNSNAVSIASNRKELIGIDFHESERYQTIRKGADQTTLYVSAPFVSALGIYSISLGKVILDENGRFNGYVLAILDPTYFETLLDSVLYAPDMHATLIHGDGKIVFRVPDPEHTIGKDLRALPNSIFTQYFNSGQLEKMFDGIPASTGEERLAVLKAIKPLSNPADKPLVISISRVVSTMYAPWRKQLVEQATMLSAIALMAALWLVFSQRRQIALARIQTLHDEQSNITNLTIRDSARSLQLAIDSARLGVWHWDIKTNHLVCSDPCLALFGLAPGTDMSYDKFLALLHPQERQRIDQAATRSLETKTDYNEDYRLIWSDGSERWINAIGRPFCSTDGTVERMEGVVQDITQRKQVEQSLVASEKEFRVLAESMPQIVWITEPDGKNIYFNHQWVEYTSMTLDESHGNGWNKSFHPDDQQRAWDAWKNALNDNGTYAVECRLRRADGVYRWWLVRGMPALDDSGRIYKWFGTCTDIHEIKLNQEELESSKRKVEVLNKALEERAIHAEAANRAKAFFIENMSHEFKTPMNAILGFCQLLQPKISDPKQSDQVGTILQSARQLLAILDNLLDFAKLESGELTLVHSEFPIRTVLEEVHTTYRKRAHAKGLDLTVQVGSNIPVALNGDSERLQLVLHNFLDNALKFTAAGSITLRVNLLEFNPEKVLLRIEIQDAGIGIEPEDMKFLFQPFVQLDTGSTRAYEGTGIGLSMNQKLVKLMGGEIGVDSRPGKGSIFWFTAHFKLGQTNSENFDATEISLKAPDLVE